MLRHMSMSSHGPFPVDEVKSEKQRLAATASVSGIQKLVAGNVAFAIGLYQQIKQDNANLVFSPHSLSSALGMTFAGAKGDTARAMETTLQVSTEPGAFHTSFNALDSAISNVTAGDRGTAGTPFRLSLVSQTFVQKGLELAPMFLDILAKNYGADVKVVDFAKAPEPSRIAINEWISSQTQKRIPSLLGTGVVTSATKMVLVNAAYFKAAWESPFKKSTTLPREFTKADGTVSTVAMMHTSETMRYFEAAGTQAVELLYDGGEMSMLVIAPALNTLDEYEQKLDISILQTLESELSEVSVALSMPAFKTESSFELTDALTALGMGAAFGPGADFSGISTEQSLTIDMVLHQGFITVDEQGTEAAAASAVLLAPTAALHEPEPPPKIFNVNRPFLFLIRNKPTGAIVFMGRTVTLESNQDREDVPLTPTAVLPEVSRPKGNAFWRVVASIFRRALKRLNN